MLWLCMIVIVGLLVAFIADAKNGRPNNKMVTIGLIAVAPLISVLMPVLLGQVFHYGLLFIWVLATALVCIRIAAGNYGFFAGQGVPQVQANRGKAKGMLWCAIGNMLWLVVCLGAFLVTVVLNLPQEIWDAIIGATLGSLLVLIFCWPVLIILIPYGLFYILQAVFKDPLVTIFVVLACTVALTMLLVTALVLAIRASLAAAGALGYATKWKALLVVLALIPLLNLIPMFVLMHRLGKAPLAQEYAVQRPFYPQQAGYPQQQPGPGYGAPQQPYGQPSAGTPQYPAQGQYPQPGPYGQPPTGAPPQYPAQGQYPQQYPNTQGQNQGPYNPQ